MAVASLETLLDYQTYSVRLFIIFKILGCYNKISWIEYRFYYSAWHIPYWYCPSRST